MDEDKQKRQLDHCRVPHDTGKFTFRHSGRGYWVVEGPVPIEVAEQLWADPVGYQIRVDGHCMAPSPVDPWIKWRMPDGTELASMETKNSLEATRVRSGEEFHNEYMKRFTFSDDPEIKSKAKAYVELYHIDSEVGLRVFVDYLHWYGLI